MFDETDDGTYDVVPTTPDDGPTVVQFVKNYFFRHEPLIVCLDVSDDVESLERLQKHAFHALDNGLTLKAVSPDGDLIGVILSTVQSRDGAKPNGSDDEGRRRPGNAAAKFDKFMGLFDKVGRETDVFAAYPEMNRVLVIEVVAVDDAFRGRGVCKRLFDKTRELALKNECSMICVRCTSRFSASAAEKLGFRCIYSLRYQDYKNDKGEVIFNSPPPHDKLTAHVLFL